MKLLSDVPFISEEKNVLLFMTTSKFWYFTRILTILKLYKGNNISLWLWGHEINLQVSDLRPEHEGNITEVLRTSLYDFNPHSVAVFFLFYFPGRQFWMFHNLLLSETFFVQNLTIFVYDFSQFAFNRYLIIPFQWSSLLGRRFILLSALLLSTQTKFNMLFRP